MTGGGWRGGGEWRREAGGERSRGEDEGGEGLGRRGQIAFVRTDLGVRLEASNL